MNPSLSEIVKAILGCIWVTMLVAILTSKDYREARGAIVIALSIPVLLMGIS